MSGRAASDAVIPGRAAISVGDPKTSLPPGWTWTPLTSIAELGTGHTPSRKHPEYWGGDVPWIGIRDAGAHHGGVIYDTLQRINQLGLDNSSARLLPKDTICLSRTASVGYVVKMGRDMATSQDFVTWSCTAAIDPDFLMQALLAEGADIRRFGEGSTHTTIYFPEVKAFHIGLPPLPEQRRIVAKIDSLTAKSRRARDHLDHIPRLVEKYKQAVLTAAFRGDLTREWRRLAGVSEAWRDVRWGDAGSTLNGRAFPSDDYVSQGIRLLRPGNLDKNGRVTWSDKNTRHLPLKYRALHPNHYIDGSEIVINLTAQSLDDQFLGRACLSSESDKFMLNQRLAIFRPFSMEKLYCLYALKSPDFRKFLDEGLNSGSLIQHIHTKNLMRYVFKVAPTVEQSEIVRRIERAFNWIDRLAAESTSARMLIDRLDQAVLAKAFRGELVPQDPADEPASVLLERIRAERGAAPKPRRGRRPAARV